MSYDTLLSSTLINNDRFIHRLFKRLSNVSLFASISAERKEKEREMTLRFKRAQGDFDSSADKKRRLRKSSIKRFRARCRTITIDPSKELDDWRVCNKGIISSAANGTGEGAALYSCRFFFQQAVHVTLLF